MEQINWGEVMLGGYPVLRDAVQRMEAGVRELEARLDQLTLMLPVQTRLEPWWFRRYAELYGMLVEAGMPGEAEGAEVARWLSERRDGAGKGANGCDAGIGSGMGLRDDSCRECAGEWQTLDLPERLTMFIRPDGSLRVTSLPVLKDEKDR